MLTDAQMMGMFEDVDVTDESLKKKALVLLDVKIILCECHDNSSKPRSATIFQYCFTNFLSQ